MELTPEDKMMAKLQGVHEKVFLFRKILDSIQELRDSNTAITKFNYTLDLASDSYNPFEYEINFTVRYFKF